MRVLFTPFSTTSHLYNVVPLAWAMRAAGHQVRIAGHPDLAEAITSAGLDAVSTGAPLNIREAIDSSPSSNEFTSAIDESCGLALVEETSVGKALRMRILGTLSMYFCADFPTGRHESMVHELIEFVREWQPDLVVWDPINVAGGLAAQLTGCPHARLPFALDYTAWMRETFLARQRAHGWTPGTDEVTRWITDCARSYGGEFDERMLSGHWTIDPTPSWMWPPIELSRVPMRKVPYNGNAPLPRWLVNPPTRPRILLSLGLSQREIWGRDQDPIQVVLDGLADLDIEVIATMSQSQQRSIQLPRNVHAVEYVPLDAVLPSCSVIIHHGGPGTYANAAARGTPQCIVPLQLWDENRVAELVHQRGAGIALPPERLTPEAARDALQRLLTDARYADAATTIRGEVLAAPSPTEVVAVLERLTAEFSAATTS